MTISNEPTTIVILDGHALAREGLCKLLQVYDDVIVVGEAADCKTGATVVEQTCPDVVLVDLDVLGLDIAESLQPIRRGSSCSEFVVVANSGDVLRLEDLAYLGVSGYLVNPNQHMLIAAIRAARYGDGSFVLSLPRESISRLTVATEGGGPVLSKREKEVLYLTSAAMTNAQIAVRLNISEATVKRHLRSVFIKLGAVSRLDAVNKAFSFSLLANGADKRVVTESPVHAPHQTTRAMPSHSRRLSARRCLCDQRVYPGRAIPSS